MEAKYYIPQISEFGIGFEYETKTPDGWQKDVYGGTQPSFGYMLPTGYKKGEIGIDNKASFLPEYVRVKCLDKQDIESLGWKHDHNDDGEEQPNQHDKHGYSMGFSIDLQDTPKYICYVLYYFPDHFMIIDSIYKCGSGREEMLFRGYIKNKSELRRLMQQLSIAEPK